MFGEKMMEMVVALVVLVCVTGAASGTTYYVDPCGSDDANGLRSDTAFATIQKGITEANDGNSTVRAVIDVNAGTYETEEIIVDNNNIKIRFQQGVEVVAKPNSFYNKRSVESNCLFRIHNRNNIIFSGNDTVFRMRKDDYAQGKDPGQWRHVIRLGSCSNIRLSGLTLKDSGGDGIYIWRSSRGASQKYCEGVTIEHVTCDNNFRSGMSVVSVNGLIVNDCVFKNSDGAEFGPWAGINFEVHYTDDVLTGIEANNIIIKDNAGRGISIGLSAFDASSKDVDINFKNTYITGIGYKPIGSGRGRPCGILVGGPYEDGPGGSIRFNNVTIEKVNFGVEIIHSALKGKLTFQNCVWKDSVDSDRWPIFIKQAWSRVRYPGGIDFNDCQIFDDQDRYAIKFNSSDTLNDVHGSIYVRNSNRNGRLYDWNDTNDVDVNVIGE